MVICETIPGCPNGLPGCFFNWIFVEAAVFFTHPSHIRYTLWHDLSGQPAARRVSLLVQRRVCEAQRGRQRGASRADRHRPARAQVHPPGRAWAVPGDAWVTGLVEGDGSRSSARTRGQCRALCTSPFIAPCTSPFISRFPVAGTVVSFRCSRTKAIVICRKK